MPLSALIFALRCGEFQFGMFFREKRHLQDCCLAFYAGEHIKQWFIVFRPVKYAFICNLINVGAVHDNDKYHPHAGGIYCIYMLALFIITVSDGL